MLARKETHEALEKHNKEMVNNMWEMMVKSIRVNLANDHMLGRKVVASSNYKGTRSSW